MVGVGGEVVSPRQSPDLLGRFLQLFLSAAQAVVPLCGSPQWDVERQIGD